MIVDSEDVQSPVRVTVVDDFDSRGWDHKNHVFDIISRKEINVV